MKLTNIDNNYVLVRKHCLSTVSQILVDNFTINGNKEVLMWTNTGVIEKA